MKVVLAKSSGYCFGVKRAVDTVYEQIEKGQNIYTYGPIVHNEEVVRELESKGVKVIENKDELRRLTSGTLIIRAHGVEKAVYEMIEQQGIECIDATCPFVKRIHDIVARKSDEGYRIVIAGDPKHPEVEGIMGWCSNGPAVIQTPEEALKYEVLPGSKVCLAAQTTFNYNKFQYIVEIFQKKYYNVSVANTICNATEERQTEARRIAASVDAMIVIGGRNSSNTRKLYEICSEECGHTYFIQTLDDLHLELPKSVRLVGITAGASTPNNIIEEVQNYVRINF